MTKLHYFLFILLCITNLPLYPFEIEFEFEVGDSGDVLPAALLRVAEEAYHLNLKGLDALGIDNFDEALDYFEQAAARLPNYSDAINNSGVVYFRRGNIGMARDIWQKVLKIDPDYATTCHNLGIVAYSEKKYEEAKSFFKQALDKNKRFIDALVMLGKIELNTGSRKAALTCLKKAYGINKAHQGAWGTLAYAYIQNGDTANAEIILKKNLKSAHALKMLGQIEAGRGHTNAAIQYLTDALAKGGDKSIYLDITQLHLNNGKCTDAVNTMESYLSRVSHPPADAWLLAGIAAKECSNIAETKRYFEQGVKYYPHDQLLRFNLGQVYFFQKDYSSADKVWSTLADTIHDPGLYHLRAVAARKQNNLEAAEKYIHRALMQDTKAEYLDFLGVVLHEKGDKEDAIIQFKKALAINPSLKSAQLNLAVSGKSEKSIAKAIEDLKKQLASCREQCSELTLQLSILYYHSRNYEKAIGTLTRIPDRDKNMHMYRHLAIYYKTQAEWDRAIQILERAAKKYELDQQTEHSLADTYCEAGLYTKAILLLQSLLKKWHGNPWRLYYQLGYASVKQHDFNRAEYNLRKSLRAKKENVAARSLLAFVYNERGEMKKARQLWEKTLKDDPNNPALWINMGLLLEKEGKYTRAIEKYQQALSLSKGNPEVYINIGNVYEQMKKPRKALGAFEKALSSDKREIAAYNVFTMAKRSNEKRKAGKMFSLLKKEFSSSLYTKRVSGEMFLWEGDTSSALKVFESLPQKNSEDWYALASIYISQGKSNRAQTALEKLPDTPHWRKAKGVLKAQISFNNGDYQQALALWKEQNDTSFEGQYNMALTAFNAQQYETAIQIGRALIQRAAGPDKIAVCRLLGNSAIKTEDWKEARSWFNQLVGIKPDDGIAWFNMAVAAYNLDNMKDAWKWYQKARELDRTLHSADIENKYKSLNAKPVEKIVFEDSLDEVYNLAVELQQQGKEAEAEALYKKIVEKDGRYYRAWNNLGAIYGARGDIEEAIDCYKNAVSRRADIADGYANLVNIYIALEDLKKAEKWLVKGKRHNPDSDVLLHVEQMLGEAKKNVAK